MTKTLSVLALAACAAPSPTTSSEARELDSIVTNGSFETGDYTGWTLLEAPTNPTAGTWGIASDGETISAGEMVFDFNDQTFISESSPGLPITYHATDGTSVALQLQTTSQDHRMFQTVALPSCQPLLLWDMSYSNHNAGGFDVGQQFIAANIRDPETDQILATPFKTNPGDPLALPMTAFQADLSAFSGQTVRLDIEQQVEQFWFDAAYDNIRIVCKGLGALPGSLDFGPVPVGSTTVAKTTSITNFADVPLTMTSLSIDPPFVVTDAPALPLTLEPGDTTQVSVALTAAPSGPVTGALVIASDDPNGDTTVALTGTGGTANVTISPTIDFGPVRVGTTSPSKLVHLENDGEASASIDSLQLPSSTFAITAELPVVLAAGASIDVPVTFTPALESPDAATVTFFVDGAPLSTELVGVGVEPHLLTSVPLIDFGPHRPDTLTRQSMTLRNAGTDALSLGSVTAPAPFGISGSIPSVLAPGDSVTFDVAFAPVTTGPFGGAVSIASDDPDSPLVMIPIAGRGVLPDIAAFPTAIDFGTARVSTTSTPRTVTITNTGSDVLTVASFDTTGPFSASGATGVAIPPGGSTTVDVAFTPPVAGASAGTLSITSDAPSSPTIVPLTGTGTAPILSVDTTPLSFGPERVGTTGTKTVVVTNVGTAPLVVASATTAPPFAVAPSGPLVVLPGARANLVVSFVATTAGPASGAVEITTDAGNAEIAMAGTGVQPLVSAVPPAHDFGDVRVGAPSSSFTFAITNPGSDTLNVTSVTFPLAFAPTTPLRLPAAVSPGGAMTFDVVFTPVHHVGYSSSIAVATDAGPAAFAVTGRGVAPTLVASLDEVPFGPVAIGTTTSLSVQLANTGDAPATVSTISVIGSPDFTIVPLALPAVVPAGGSLTASVAFAPTDHGLRSAKVVVTSDAPVVSFTASGTGSGARAIVAPGSLDLGSTNVGSTTAARGVTVSNTGDVGLVISAIVIAGPAAPDFTSTTTLPVTVGPGASLVLPFTLAPTVVGTRTATATLVTTDPLVPSSQVALSGAGTSPAISVGPPSVEFGGINVGTKLAKAFSITNTGSGPLSITSVDVGGTDASQFFVDPFAVPAVLAPSATTIVHVTYAPTALGTANATVTVLSDDPSGTVSVVVSGTGTSPSVAVTPSDIDFGAQVVGHPSALRQVHVTNLGNGPLIMTSLAITGAEASRFTVVSPPPLPASIAAGNELVLSVRATPHTTGSAPATLEIDTNAAPATVSLDAIGVAAALSITPASIDFGSTHVPATTAPVTVTMTNLSSDPIDLVDAVVGGGSPGAFTVSSVAGSLAPGASTTAVVTFAPTTAGVDAATLTFAAKDSTIPQAVVTIGGKAMSTFITVDRDALSFGTIELGDHSGPKQVTLTNVTTAPVTVASVVAADAQFVVDGAPTAPIAPGHSATFAVTFAPNVETTTASTVAITLAGATTPELVVAVTGDGATRTDTSSCSSTRSSSLWIAIAVIALCRRRRRYS